MVKLVPIDFFEKKDEVGILVKDIPLNKNKVITVGFKPYIYSSVTDYKIISKIISVEPISHNKEEKIFLGKKVEVLKLVFSSISDFYKARRNLDNNQILYFEADFPIVKKFLHDTSIKPFVVYETKGELSDISSLKRVEEMDIDKVNILAFDIETYGAEINFEKNPILMVSFYGMVNGKLIKKVISWVKNKSEHPDFVSQVNSEKELIEKFVSFINENQPDILVGYFSDSFDLPYIIKRAALNKVKLDFIGGGVSIKRSRMPSVMIKGVVHIDLFRVVRNFVASYLKTDSYDLNSVAEEILNEGKVKVELKSLSKHWDKNDLEKFYYYNLKDSELAFKLMKKLLPNLMEITRLTGLSIFDVSRMSYSQIVEWHLIRKAEVKNILVPNKPTHKEIISRHKRSYEGAFVFEPTPGIYKNIIVFDFKSLYPTIIDAHNISPDTFKHEPCKKKEEVPKFKEYWFCRDNKGFIPSVINQLIKERSVLKDKLKKQGKNKDPFLLAREKVLKIKDFI